MKTNTGGSAFPKQPIYKMPHDVELTTEQGGMTLRDYFAAKAMPALLAEDGTDACNFRTRAREAYEMADAMIAERGAE